MFPGGYIQYKNSCLNVVNVSAVFTCLFSSFMSLNTPTPTPTHDPPSTGMPGAALTSHSEAAQKVPLELKYLHMYCRQVVVPAAPEGGTVSLIVSQQQQQH